ncbi:protein DpdD [Lentzea sp.]|uniref:protein DpdD n=1 Tax=Lentzea sp. TaxID=56099 RepID=UPI002ED1B2A1
MSGVDRATAWNTFVTAFFSGNNQFTATSNEVVEWMVTHAEKAWLTEPSSPFFLPMKVAGWTYWYAICPDRDQRLWVRDLIRAHVGSWIVFDGWVVPDDSHQAMDAEVRSLVGPEGCSFRFLIPKHPNAGTKVKESLERLTRMLAARPHRKVRLTPPLGTLIGDFWDACASGAQVRAEELLAQLERDHRLSKTNRLFLRLQYLAVFEQWDSLESLEQLPDLLRLDRPVLASDALARLALARLPEQADLEQFGHAMAKFGCLVPSVTAIRSPAGARYYAYWSLASGEPVADVVSRLLEAGWLDHARGHQGLASLLSARVDPDPLVAVETDPENLRNAVVEKRFDAAIDMIATAAPTAALLPVLADLLVETFHPRLIDLYKQWRSALDAVKPDSVLSRRLVGETRELDLVTVDFGQAIEQAFTAVTAVERTRALENLSAQAVPRLMRVGALADVMEAVRPLSQELGASMLPELVDLLLNLERDLFGAAGDVPGIQDLRLLVVEVWALGDQSGDRRRANRLLDVVGRALDFGVWPKIYDEIVDNLHAGWKPFFTDADVAFGLEAIEVLAANRPDSGVALDSFATQLLSRIGAHNAHRFDAALLDTALVLATEFGLDLSGVLQREPGEERDGAERLRLPDGVFIAIYSLMESAARRAAEIMRRRHPGIRVETLVAKVATDALRSAAQTADVLVVADKAAAHAATDALKAARGNKTIHYANGKGTASLVRAVVNGLEMEFGR